MESAIAVIEDSEHPVLPDLDDVAGQIAHLIEEGEGAALDEIRRRAEALMLYENRKRNAESERHFAKLRLLAEAGLGSLSYDDPTVIKSEAERAAWRSLAAAFERGKLLSICDEIPPSPRGRDRSLATQSVASEIRDAGLTCVPGRFLGGSAPTVKWIVARRIIRERGLDAHQAPPDRRYITERRRARQEASQRMQKLYRANERLEQTRLRKLTAAAARNHGPRIAEAFSLLRRLLDELQSARDSEFAGEANVLKRHQLDRAFTSLYKAEDAIAEALNVDF
jgi:hypothetical protein